MLNISRPLLPNELILEIFDAIRPDSNLSEKAYKAILVQASCSCVYFRALLCPRIFGRHTHKLSHVQGSWDGSQVPVEKSELLWAVGNGDKVATQVASHIQVLKILSRGRIRMIPEEVARAIGSLPSLRDLSFNSIELSRFTLASFTALPLQRLALDWCYESLTDRGARYTHGETLEELTVARFHGEHRTVLGFIHPNLRTLHILHDQHPPLVRAILRSRPFNRLHTLSILTLPDWAEFGDFLSSGPGETLLELKLNDVIFPGHAPLQELVSQLSLPNLRSLTCPSFLVPYFPSERLEGLVVCNGTIWHPVPYARPASASDLDNIKLPNLRQVHIPAQYHPHLENSHHIQVMHIEVSKGNGDIDPDINSVIEALCGFRHESLESLIIELTISHLASSASLLLNLPSQLDCLGLPSMQHAFPQLTQFVLKTRLRGSVEWRRAVVNDRWKPYTLHAHREDILELSMKGSKMDYDNCLQHVYDSASP